MSKHIDANGNELRCVYLAYFDADNYCYVGTTNDYEERIVQHLFKDRKSEVYMHKRHTGFVPTFSMLHDYTSVEEADNLELYYTIENVKLGRKILNVQTPGGYGHKKNNAISPRVVKGRINEGVELCDAKVEYDKTVPRPYRRHHKRTYSDSVKKVYGILVEICKRVSAEGGEFICVRKNDFPFDFDNDELSLYNIDKVRKLCAISYVNYVEEYEHLSYLKFHGIDNDCQSYNIQCQYEDRSVLEKICDEIYKKSYVFKITEPLQRYYNENLEHIDDEVTQILLSREITVPFTQKVDVERLGYRDCMACRKIDYSLMLSNIGGLCSPSFDVEYDSNWNLSNLSLCISYNAYSIWAKRYDSYEMQESEKQKKFTKLVEKIDNFILTEKNKITDFPKRIEFLAKDLRITEIDTLRSFMRHFYVCHGTAWDTGSPDSCICSIENYNGNNMNECKLIVYIQGDQFFINYDLKNHILDDSNSWLNNSKR